MFVLATVASAGGAVVHVVHAGFEYVHKAYSLVEVWEVYEKAAIVAVATHKVARHVLRKREGGDDD